MEYYYLEIALAIIAVGVLLLVGEFFLPSGLMVVAGIFFFAVAMALIYAYGSRTEAIIGTIGLCIGMPAVFAGMFQVWKRFSLKSGLDPDAAGGSITTAMNELSGLEKLRGRHGKVITPMKPSGMVEIDGRRVDAMSEGMMIDANAWIRCVDVRAGRVIVRQIDTPGDLNTINLEM